MLLLGLIYPFKNRAISTQIDRIQIAQNRGLKQTCKRVISISENGRAILVFNRVEIAILNTNIALFQSYFEPMIVQYPNWPLFHGSLILNWGRIGPIVLCMNNGGGSRAKARKDIRQGDGRVGGYKK